MIRVMPAWYRRRAAGYPSCVRSVSNLIRLVQIRLRVQRWVDVTSPALLVGFAIALPGLVLSRVFGARGDVLALAMLVAAATAVAWLLAQLHPPINALRAAVEADERLGLEGRLASALALVSRSDAFAQAAVQDAERVARDPALRAMVRRVFALRWPRSTPWIPVVAAVLLLCAWLQPVRVAAPVVSAGIEASVTPAEQQARADAAEASVAKALDTISDNPEAREQLKDMLAQMEQPRGTDMATRDPAQREADAAARAAALEERLGRALDSESSQQADRLKDLLASLPEMEGSAKPLSEALKSGDLQEAMKQLDALAKQAEGSDAKQAAEAKQALSQMSNALQQLASNQRGAMQALKEAGMDPALASNPQQAQQAIEQNQQLTPQQKQALQKKMQASQKAAEQCKNLGNSMQPSGKPGSMGEAQKQLSRAASSQAMQRALQKAMGECKGGSSMGWSMPWEVAKSGGSGAGNGGKGGQKAGKGGAPNINGSTEALKDGQLAEKQESAGDGDPLGDAVARDFVRGQGAAPVGASSPQLKAVAARVEAGLEEGTEEDPVPGRLKAAHKRYFEQWKKQLDPSKPVGGGTP
jgi:septal ring factor EnvC (AmiA/AmiB activator)